MAYSNQLNMVIRLIGPQAAIRMSRSYGGRAYLVPKAENLHDLHPLVVTIGMDHAKRLAERFEGQPLKFPYEVNTLIQIRNDLIFQRHMDGDSQSSIAVDLQIDRKMVEKVIRAYEAMGRVAEDASQRSLV